MNNKSSSAALKKQFLAIFLINPPKIVETHYRLSKEQTLKKGCIIDVETDGLDPHHNRILTLGILKRNIAQVHQLTKADYGPFKSFAVEKTIFSPEPRYAYNARFEQDFLSEEKGWHDLTQYAKKEGFYGTDDFDPFHRLRLDSCTLTPFTELDIVGSDVPRLWQEWLSKHKPESLWQITLHCLSDLLRTRQLIKT